MRVKNAENHHFRARAALAAGLVCMLALTGCATSRSVGEPASAEEGAERSAEIANKGAHTTKVTKLQKFMWFFSPYRPDIQQGNFVSQEMIDQLKVGMTRDQVKYVLGTPLLTDAFHADRWDYPFYLARGNGELTTSRVTVFFKDNQVERFEGGNLPSEREYIERIAGPAKGAPNLGPKKEPERKVNVEASKGAGE